MNIEEYADKKFDFIYCRHVIEHLINPVLVLNRVISYLNDNGKFVVQFPNGDSLEYLAYPNSTIKDRFASIRKTNNFSKLKVLWIILNGGMLHGIDPPRHLWAITKDGIKKWADKKKIVCDVYSYHLGDPVFSPYYKKSKGFKCKLKDFVGQQLFASICGGTHLVAVLKRNIS